MIGLALCATQAAAGGPPDAVDPGPRLLTGADASEHWDLVAHFDSGYRLYARFLITNEGPGERTAVAFGHLVKPDGETVFFRNGRREGEWELADAGRRIEIGSSVLHFGEVARRFEVDNDKRGIKVHFELPADAPGLAAPPGPGGVRLDLLNLASPARGSVWVTDMAAPLPLTGRALLTHTWSERRESDAVRQRMDFASLESGPGIFVSDLRGPDRSPWTWLAVTTPEGTLRGRTDVRIEGRPVEEDPRPYPIPERLELGGKSLSGSIVLEDPPVLVSDPLDALPTLLKMVYSFGGRPRQLWTDAVADIALDPRGVAPGQRIQSAGTANFFFADAQR